MTAAAWGRLAPVRRGSIARLVAIGVAVAIPVVLVALLIRWLPESASVEMDRIARVYWFATAISIVIFSAVTAVVVFSVWKFRAPPDDDADGPPVHGHTGLEVVWTIIPAVLVVAIGVFSAVVLAQNGDAGTSPLRVEVTAQQFAWKFSYPGQGGFTSGELVLPLDETVKLELKALDVIHSFWIPEMAQKQDAVPGIDTSILVTPTRTGVYPVICTELCGLGHATMRATARVVTKAEFDSWARRQAR